ncbi:MAG: DnaJ C-terminal domain-containing protein [Collinsella sp.]
MDADARRRDGSLKVPAGTQTGKKFRFMEMGAPDVKHRGRTGALLVEIKVQVPRTCLMRARCHDQAARGRHARLSREGQPLQGGVLGRSWRTPAPAGL